MDQRVSVVIITHNEEARIGECLESVKWADELIVLDDASTDKTREIAQRYTDKVFTRKMDIEGRHRNYGYSLAKNEWVLSLDADERITPELKEEIGKAIRNPGGFSAFAIPRRNYIGNHWLKFGGWYPSAQLKLFQKSKFKWEEVGVHPRAFLNGICGQLKSDIIHLSYRDFEDFIAKQDNQTTREAEKWFKEGRKMSLAHALWRTADRFFRSYIRKKAYKDGFIGFIISVLAGWYQITSYAKYWELKRIK